MLTGILNFIGFFGKFGNATFSFSRPCLFASSARPTLQLPVAGVAPFALLAL